MWKYVAFVLLLTSCVAGSLPATNGSVEVDSPAPNQNITVTDGLDTNQSDPVTNASETTTRNASETTTQSIPETTTQSVPITTSSAPTTTALPPPAVGKYAIHEKDDVNKTCLRVEMALRVDISDLHVLYNLPQNASTDGSDCNASDHTQILKLTDEHLGHSLTFIFVQENKRNYVQNISFVYSSSVEINTSGQYFSASEGKSYLCDAEMTVHKENITLTFSSVHIQAFGAQSFGLAEECDADDKVGDIVPIAVGCALGALVVVVLIAYLVGRRRSRQRGYQSV